MDNVPPPPKSTAYHKLGNIDATNIAAYIYHKGIGDVEVRAWIGKYGLIHGAFKDYGHNFPGIEPRPTDSIGAFAWDSNYEIIKATWVIGDVAANDPLAAVEIVGGAALVVTGVGTTAGLGLIGKGSADIYKYETTQDSVYNPTTGQMQASGGVVTTGNTSTFRGVVGGIESEFQKFEKWLKDIFEGGNRNA